MDIAEEGKQLKRDLESLREISLQIWSLLVWKRPADPGIIFGIVTFVFLIFWYLDPSVLTTIALLGLIATLFDYFAPIASAKFFPLDSWNGQKEKSFEELCNTIVCFKSSARKHLSCFMELRKTQKTKFFAVVTAELLLLTWIGNSFNNLLLTYFVVLIILLTPGLASKGLLAPVTKAISMLCCCNTKEEVKKLD